MEEFIKTPNLPHGKVKLGVVDGRIINIMESKFNDLKIKLIKTDRISGLYEAVAYHPDLQLHHIEDNLIVIPPNVSNRFVYQLEEEGFLLIVGKSDVGKEYPCNIHYNAARVGNNLICNTRYIDEAILHAAEKRNLNIIEVKQGYSKCSICVVNENAIITSDNGIYNTCSQNGIDCLKISVGYIKIEGLNYGFIGGSTGYLSANELGFYGNIALHPDYVKIKKFLDKYKKQYINLSENLVYDFGTFIPLKEYSILTK